MSLDRPLRTALSAALLALLCSSTGARAALERAYRTRDIVYLLGTADADPNHHQLDKSCSAEQQGDTRLSRGRAYFSYLEAQSTGPFAQHLLEVPGVGHHSPVMYGSACGLDALFDRAGCDRPVK